MLSGRPSALAAVLTVPWTRVPMYNTIMGLAAGVGLLLLVWFGAGLLRRRPVEFEGWALAFGIVGLLQFATGLHMTLTWPIAFIAPWGLPGAVLVLFVAMNFFTHGGLTYNTQ